MRPSLAAILLLAPALSLGQAQNPLPETTFTSLEQALRPLARKYTGVSFTVPRKEMTKGWANVNFKPVSKEDEAARYLAMFVEEFAKYPTDFVQKSGLKRIEFVEKLAVGSQFRAAVPDYVNEVLYYDVSYVANLRYVRHVVHHEFYHMLEQEWNGNAYYKDPNWILLNDKEHKYGVGGADAYGRGDVWSFVHPRPGFINLYSTYGVEEDKAEIWAVLFVPDNWKIVSGFLDEDPILRAKVSYMREYGRSKSTAMSEAFWKSVAGESEPLNVKRAG